MPNLAPRQPGWRRHLPPLLLLLALCALILALARPQRTVAAPQRAANIVMVTDISGSMNATDVQPDRLTAAVERGQDARPTRCRRRSGSAWSSFSDYAEQRVAPTTDRSQIKGALDQLQAEGGTAMGDGLERGLVVGAHAGPERQRQRRTPAAVGDRAALGRQEHVGHARPDRRRARGRQASHIPIFAIALGTPGGEVELRDSFGFLQRVQVPPDTETLKEIARVSGGKSYTATETDKLKEIYANLGTRLSLRSEKREVTAAFAGGAIFLLIAAGSLSLRWFGRLI